MANSIIPASELLRHARNALLDKLLPELEAGRRMGGNVMTLRPESWDDSLIMSSYIRNALAERGYTIDKTEGNIEISWTNSTILDAETIDGLMEKLMVALKLVASLGKSSLEIYPDFGGLKLLAYDSNVKRALNRAGYKVNTVDNRYSGLDHVVVSWL